MHECCSHENFEEIAEPRASWDPTSPVMHVDRRIIRSWVLPGNDRADLTFQLEHACIPPHPKRRNNKTRLFQCHVLVMRSKQALEIVRRPRGVGQPIPTLQLHGTTDYPSSWPRQHQACLEKFSQTRPGRGEDRKMITVNSCIVFHHPCLIVR